MPTSNKKLRTWEIIHMHNEQPTAVNVKFSSAPVDTVQTANRSIYIFNAGTENVDPETVKSFGEEWNAFHSFDRNEIKKIGDEYFDIINHEMLNEKSAVLEVGCGSGRFVWYLKDRVKYIVGLDPSDAIYAADNLIGKDENVILVKASASSIPFENECFDFVYSIGVLHHIPDTAKAMRDCVAKLKPGGYFLTYLYYNLDNRGAAFRLLFNASNVLRKRIATLPTSLKKAVCDVLALTVYMPFVLTGRALKLFGVPKQVREKMPLHAYENRSFYIIRNDALDRFGTPLEQRFTKPQIEAMMKDAGLTDIVFSNNIPYWHAVGRKQ